MVVVWTQACMLLGQRERCRYAGPHGDRAHPSIRSLTHFYGGIRGAYFGAGAISTTRISRRVARDSLKELHRNHHPRG